MDIPWGVFISYPKGSKLAKTVMLRSKMCKFAFLKIVNSVKKVFERLTIVGPLVRVRMKTERAMEVL